MRSAALARRWGSVLSPLAPCVPPRTVPLRLKFRTPRTAHVAVRGPRGWRTQVSSAMELTSPCSSFQSDLDFCPDCGSVLPLPGAQDTVVCPRCGFSIDVRDFEGKVVKTSVVFHKLGAAIPTSVDEGPESQGPVVDRRCPRCGHEGMAYHTRQMRSADEGQTVFYTCINCKFQEKEDS